MAKIKSPAEAFVLKLQALYDIEQELVKALPKMAKAAVNPALRDGFRMHLEETKGHVQRLEQAFKIMDSKPKKLKCEGIRGIIADSAWVMKCEAEDATKDAMLAAAARYAEHYEMAGYLSAIDEAEMLDLENIADLLTQTLEEEKAADEKLIEAMKSNMEKAIEEAEKDDDQK